MRNNFVLLIIICILVSVSLSGQESGEKEKSRKKIKVTGYVKDEAGSSLGGVNIFLNGAKTNIMTNSKGFYKIKVKPGVETISAFSLFDGIQEVEFNGQERINFVLSNINAEEQSDLPENALGKHINAVDMTKTEKSRYASIYQMIKSEVPGVTVSGEEVKIRSSSSFMLSTKPLFVLDGVVVSDISAIPPEIVKSIEILKGPSTAIYGAKAANGVILIKTK